VEEYIGVEAGDITFDLSSQVRKSRDSQKFAISEIDRIKAVDVPWKCYLVLYTILIIGAAVGSFIVGMTYRVNSNLIVMICAGFMVSLTVMFMIITFFGFKAEEE